MRAGLAVLLLTVAGILVPISPSDAAPVQISYIVAAHPDDEYSLWSLVTGSTGNYKVLIYLTHGEQTSACMSASETTSFGPYWYQGPSSPVGQPNYSEINARGTGTSWAGRWTTTCRDARRRGTQAFYNDKAATDPAIPSGFTSRGVYSFPGNTIAGIPPRRDDNGVIVDSRLVSRPVRAQ